MTTDSQLPPSLFGGTPALLESPVDNTNPIKSAVPSKTFPQSDVNLVTSRPRIREIRPRNRSDESILSRDANARKDSRFQKKRLTNDDAELNQSVRKRYDHYDGPNGRSQLRFCTRIKLVHKDRNYSLGVVAVCFCFRPLPSGS